MANTINTTTLINLMSNIKGATICTLTTETTPKMNKRGNALYGRVKKVSVGQYQFGYSYENAVNNRLAMQGNERTFEAQSRPYGVWVIPNKIAEHNGAMYLRFYAMSNNKPSVSYFVDGRPATAEELDIIKFFTPERKPSATQAAEGLTDNQVKPCEFRAESIRKISINGAEYEVVQAEQQTAEISR